MNKKGHIGTLFLAIIALILIVNALFAMNGFSENIGKTKSELRLLSNKMNKYHQSTEKAFANITLSAIKLSSDSPDFEEAFNNSIRSLASKERASGLSTNLYGKLSLGEYSLEDGESNYVLTVDGIFEQTQVGLNEGRLYYKITATFNRTSLLSVEVS